MSDITENAASKITQQRDSIVDSLNYAKYIQRSLLPDIKKMENYFGENLFFYSKRYCWRRFLLV